jgi:type VI secretion system protein ImpA
MAEGTSIDAGTARELARSPVVDAWLEPLPDQACGGDLEYDDDFREMQKASVGKAGTQFAGDSDAEPPNWRTVAQLAEGMFERTRDVRIAIFWARARLQLDGFASLPASLRLVHGLLERWWDEAHPLLDDGDAYARVNALNDMCTPAGLLGDVRDSLVLSNRTIGEVRGRDIEVANGALEARATDPGYARSQIEQMMADAAAADPTLAQAPAASLHFLGQMQELMRERVGYASAPDLAALSTMIDGIAAVMPQDTASESSTEGADGEVAAAAAGPRTGGRSGLPAVIDTRADALKAIDMVCDYLERTEPTNPAQLLLRRARRLVNKNFLELVKELAPDSLDQVARIMGMSPDEVASE